MRSLQHEWPASDAKQLKRHYAAVRDTHMPMSGSSLRMLRRRVRFGLVQRIGRRFGLLIVVVTLVFAGESGASAETYNHADARHDVESYPQGVHTPRNRASDVTHLRVVHSDKTIRISVTLRSAALSGSTFRIVAFDLKTPGHRYTGDFISHPGEVQYDLWNHATGRTINCDEWSSRSGRTVSLMLDRSCLHKPRWIRAAVTVITNNDSGAGRVDNPLSDDWRRGDNPVFGPRVHSTK